MKPEMFRALQFSVPYFFFGRSPAKMRGQPVPIFREAPDKKSGQVIRYIFFPTDIERSRNAETGKKDAAPNKRSDSRNTAENQLWNRVIPNAPRPNILRVGAYGNTPVCQIVGTSLFVDVFPYAPTAQIKAPSAFVIVSKPR